MCSLSVVTRSFERHVIITSPTAGGVRVVFAQLAMWILTSHMTGMCAFTESSEPAHYLLVYQIVK